jgi:cytochrome c2
MGWSFRTATAGVSCPLLVSLGLLVPAAGQTGNPPPDSERGRALARTWCVHCHSVEASRSKQQADGLPSFVAVANDPHQTPERLRLFLTKPHGRMPDLNLSVADREDLIAYLRTLRQLR